MALGKTRFVRLARLEGYSEFALWTALIMADVEHATVALPGWWQQMISSQRREVRRVVAELLVTRGMMPLLMKSRNGGSWTPAEKAELLGYLRRMAHLSPYLIALILPGSVLILPVYAWWLDRRRVNRSD